MKRLFIIMTILFLAVPYRAQVKDADDPCRGISPKVVALINQYKELREKQRRLPERVYDKDLRGHGGRLHRVLSALGVELGRPPLTKQTIVECVGEPDDIKVGREMDHFLDIYNRELKKAGRKSEENKSREYLIYYWRGGHDFLFFISEDGHVVDHGWWFAYE